MEPNCLKYTDLRDKAYGATGMAITLVAIDAEDLFTEITLDDSDGSLMHMAVDFGIEGNPRLSAKIIWSQALKDLKTITSMALGNIACRRRLMRSQAIEREALDKLRELTRQQGAEACGIEPDEADALFDSCHNYVHRLFANPEVQSIARQFCDHITDRRSMTANEVIEYFAARGLR